MRRCLALSAVGLLALSAPAFAHFQEILPSSDLVGPAAPEVVLDLVFTHPMARGPVMAMKRPVRFGVASAAGEQDLLSSLQEISRDGAPTWQASYRPSGPGDYIFYVEPAPYWEEAEQKSIIHYAKVVVDAYDAGTGWDQLLGLPVEIEPLTRPYGLWTGNLFSGVVRKGGKPVPFAEIEVEWVNDGTVTPPADAHVTQVIKADANGTFSYGLPRAGWWGFAALVDGDTPLPGPDGKPHAVELGGLIWVRATDMK